MWIFICIFARKIFNYIPIDKAVTYGIIAVVKWLTDNWVLVLCIMGGVVAVVGIAAVIAIIIRKRKNKAGLEVSTDESN